ncbi:hypothetical protein GCM10011505_42930 [Tistrella bauzanensis]|uniref:PAS domain-containing protein n=1 Tax=Tistrella bauzanensis TaxID=657419 RepID=A0ABQ1J133_9PROT|nr:PAS domain-containing protein [Tistrella bauzanensis]GGB57464.1 hypothetical protein GCM10011505_42930 [Tistrella bauzanensis]
MTVRQADVDCAGFRRGLGRASPLVDLFALWRGWGAATGGLPAPRAVDPVAMRRHLGRVMLLDVTGPDRWLVRVAGEGLREMFDADLTGHVVPDSLPPELRARALATYGPVTAEAVCWLAIACYRRPGPRRRVFYRRMVLPLGHLEAPAPEAARGAAARPVVTRLLVGFDWRVLPPLSLPLWELLDDSDAPKIRRDLVLRRTTGAAAG